MRVKPLLCGDVNMNRNLIIAVVVLVLAVGGYYQFVSKPAKEAAAAAMAEADAVAAAAKAEADAAAAKVADEAAAAAKMAEEAAAKAAADAATAVTDGTAAMTDTATSAMTAVEDMLKPENFDLAKVTAAIDASALDDATKTTLKAALDKVKDAPALLPPVLEQIKAALMK